MGVVYKALDTKLDREVALKFLPSNMLAGDDIRRRFEREAKASAALSHPNVCHVYEIDEAEGHTFIAMALIKGQPLDKKIERGPLKLDEVLAIAQQIAAGLEAAHEKGIVHRDIKPQNVMVDSKGHVTIMDFGLAQLVEVSRLTREGTTIGTVSYMSPEQTEGSGTDHRTDIWSLGVVVYEMVTGLLPFRGDYEKAVMYSILNEDPEPITALRTGVPMELEVAVNKALAKSQDARYKDVGDLAVDLRAITEKQKSGRSMTKSVEQAPHSAKATVPSTTGPRAAWLPWTLFAISTIISAILASLYWNRAPLELPNYAFSVSLPEGATRLHTLALSPDGRHVALAVSFKNNAESLWVRSLETQELRELSGTYRAQYPFWSPDSQHIGFFADSKLKKIALRGGPAQTLCDASDGRGGSWNEQGLIVFSPSPVGEIHAVSDAGGEPTAVTARDESQTGVSRRFPHFLPDGRHFLYLDRGSEEETGIYIGSVDGARSKRLLSDESIAFYAPSSDRQRGFLLFVRDRTLMAQPFLADELSFDGDAFPVAETIGRAANLSNYAVAISGNGSLVYADNSSQRRDTQLAWYDRSGVEVEKWGEPAVILQVSLSPDERTAALTISENSNTDLWLLDLSRDLRSRFTTHSSADLYPAWSGDGSFLAFSSERTGDRGVYRKRVSAGEAESLIPEDAAQIELNVTDWSKDGRFLLVESQSGSSLYDLFVVPLEDGADPVPFLASQFNEIEGQFSPDGRWIAYQSDKSGRHEIYVRNFPEGDKEWPISSDGGATPVWSSNGNELFYLSSEGVLMVVAVSGGESLGVSVPQKLFQTRIWGLSGRFFRGYDVGSDGNRFLIANQIEDSAAPQLTVVTDWLRSVER